MQQKILIKSLHLNLSNVLAIKYRVQPKILFDLIKLHFIVYVLLIKTFSSVVVELSLLSYTRSISLFILKSFIKPELTGFHYISQVDEPDFLNFCVIQQIAISYNVSSLLENCTSAFCSSSRVSTLRSF